MSRPGLPLALLTAAFAIVAACDARDTAEAKVAADGAFVPSPVVSCRADEVDHEAQCPAPDCPLDIDVSVSCEDPGMAAGGIRVGPGAAGPWLATTSASAGLLLDVEESDVTSRVGVPASFAGQTLLGSCDASGGLHLVANESADGLGAYAAGVGWSGFDGGAWTHQRILEEYAYLLGLDLSSVGSPDVWLQGYSAARPSLESRGEEAEWTSADTSLSSDQYWQVVGLDPQGRAVAWALDPHGEEWQLVTSTDGATPEPIGDPFSWSGGGQWFRPARPPPEGLASDQASAVAARLTPVGLYVSWSGDGAVEELLLPDTALADHSCDGVAPPCTDTCHEIAVGLAGGGTFATARGIDGAVWVAWVVTTFDRELAYVYNPEEDGEGDSCDSTILSDESTYALDLARVDRDGTVVSVLRGLDLGGQGPIALNSTSANAYAIDIGVSQDAVAVAVVTQNGDEVAIRVLQMSSDI